MSKVWGDGVLCAMDTGEATYRALGSEPHAITVLDPDGKIVFQANEPAKGSVYYRGPEKLPVMFADLRKAVEPHKDKGLLGGLELPSKFAPIAAAIKQGRLARAQSMLTKVSDKGAAGTAKAELAKRLEALRKKKLAFLESLLADGKHWDAYKVGASYVRCFPQGDGVEGVKTKLRSLKSNADVKNQLDARKAFRRYAAACYGPRRQIKAPERAKMLFGKLARKYEGTEYGNAASKAVE